MNYSLRMSKSTAATIILTLSASGFVNTLVALYRGKSIIEPIGIMLVSFALAGWLYILLPRSK